MSGIAGEKLKKIEDLVGKMNLFIQKWACLPHSSPLFATAHRKIGEALQIIKMIFFILSCSYFITEK